MSILIKGMEMPKNCRECRFCNGQADTDYGVCAWCDVDGNARDAYTMQDCPLNHVPPHGRLIDADALREDWLENGENEYVYDTNAFLDSLDRAPTIISAEEGE